MRGHAWKCKWLGIGAAAVWACSGGAAQAAEIVDEIPVNPGISPLYAIEPGAASVWQTSPGSTTINEIDPDTGSVVGSFEHGYGSNWTPRGLSFYNGRLYVADGLSPMRIVSWDAESADDTDPDRVTSDSDLNNRLGTNQAIVRTGVDGGAVALGQSNKVATFNPADLDATPYYPHAIFGAGISDPSGTQTAFQACAYSGGGVIIGTPDADCGFYLGKPGGSPGQFDYAIDSAFGDDGIYVLEYQENSVTFVSLSGDGCPCASFDIGLPGGASNFPFSIRRAPGSTNLLISSSGNRRIDEVTTTGEHLRSFGFGVRTGANEFETCENNCLPGLPTATEPRSNFTRLDVTEGLLYAATPNDGSIQVISLDDGPRVELKAKPRRVKKGERTTLTATLTACEAGDRAQFQRKDGQSFDNLGADKALDGGCQAKKRVKITKKSVFRALAKDSGGSTIATSSKVTVKLR
jgi:hypothetical protein